ncbi:MAG: dTMP kinase [Victivallales bacterium]|nr:dTMP kinase [Victivallales bacterium]
MQQQRGLFITFEGPDGSGKSTQVDLLAEWLQAQGREVLRTREPGGTPLAERVRSLLLERGEEEVSPETELLLFGAARAQHVRRVILPFLERGGVVLCDRFLDSTTAYQGYARHLDLDFVQRLHLFCTAGRLPDLTFLFDISVQEARQRQHKRDDAPDRMEAEADQFHTLVRNAFLDIAARDPARVKVLDARLSIPELAALLQKEVQNVLAP